MKGKLMKNELPQVGASDPQLETSTIIDESEYDEHAASRDLETEEGACHFNGTSFPIGTYVLSGSELLQCNDRGDGSGKARNGPTVAVSASPDGSFVESKDSQSA